MGGRGGVQQSEVPLELDDDREGGTLLETDPAQASTVHLISEDPREETTKSIAPPLFVDLDGTLIKSDLLLEGCFALIKRNPVYLFSLIVWALRGRAFLKAQVASHADLDVALLPYNTALLAFLSGEAKQGRTLVLATGSHRRLANRVALHLGIFARVIASDDVTNRVGNKKLQAILADCPDGRFDYAGNGDADIPVVAQARKAILVHPSPGLTRAGAQYGNVEFSLAPLAGRAALYLRAIRVHQWAKNLLLLAPLAAGQLWGIDPLLKVLGAMLAFSFCASGVYLLNDLLDLPSDRAHPRKRNRPLASGELSLATGAVLAVVLPVAGLLIGGAISQGFLGLLVVYLALTSLYSVYLKKTAVVDVIALAGLYTLRVVAGGVAIGAMPSFWMLAFAMFLFLSLALVKRCAELKVYTTDETATARRVTVHGRGYVSRDYDLLQSLGTAAGYVSVLVIAMFINTPDIAQRYARPEMLWMLCPAVLFWVSRLWMKTARGEMNDDPLVFSLRDGASRYVAVFFALTLVVAQ